MFGRAFRTHVQPVELARKLAKEMDEHRTISVSRVYVPNEYSVYLAEADREQFAGYEGSLIGELQDYLVEHARRESYALLTPPRVLIETDDDLVGRRVRDRDADGAARGQARPGADEPRGAGRARRDDDLQGEQPQRRRPPRRPSSGWSRSRPLTMNGRKHAVEGDKVVLGRSKDCDIQLEDAERLAPARRAAAGGRVLLARRPRLDERHRGERQARAADAKLEDGDTLTLGCHGARLRGGAPQP